MISNNIEDLISEVRIGDLTNLELGLDRRICVPARYLTVTSASHEVDRGVRRFSLHELKVATNSFASKNQFYCNGFSKLYKGRLANGSLVAVKKLVKREDFDEQMYFKTEVKTMSISVHPNLLRLLGVCIARKEKMFVYPFMLNGSVASCTTERMSSQSPLDWQVRKRIALGTASGLACLHNECERKIIHRDIKAANIFLNEDFDAIIGNFGISIVTDHVITDVPIQHVCGTIGHIAPEYLAKSICSEKSDVYGYGIFLLELITRQTSFDLDRLAHEEDMMLVDWVKRILVQKKWEMIADPHLRGRYIEEGVGQTIKIALLCTQTDPKRRPNMSKIVSMLRFGDGLLAQSWEEYFYNEEMLSCSPRQSVELSNPR
ncbi:hypothetical protein MIMGU_mgv1a024796mg [Erythranthe guttata]|uniref:non-specific serine/threonine protein kinase n=1 Tax=Erythranthe guttata TaxID=4155 RepID=A0A022RLS1_ERYGU|nr:hypothetical protein MIMGU_mgv1a024796mg [Erythranthe guttata]